jgi:hypothetical protein
MNNHLSFDLVTFWLNVAKSRLMKEAIKGKKLTSWETKFNKAIRKMRYKVERPFAGQARWFGAGIGR